MFLIRVAFSIIFVFILIEPKVGWFLLEGWKFKNADPSQAYLVLSRIITVILLIAIWVI